MSTFPFSDTGLPPSVSESDLDGSYGRTSDLDPSFEDSSVPGDPARPEPSREAVLAFWADRGEDIVAEADDEMLRAVGPVQTDEAHRAIGRRLVAALRAAKLI